MSASILPVKLPEVIFSKAMVITGKRGALIARDG